MRSARSGSASTDRYYDINLFPQPTGTGKKGSSLFKVFKVTEGLRPEFRIEAANIFNHANYNRSLEDRMGSLNENEAQSAGITARRRQPWGVFAILIAIAFLIGFVPMWMKVRERTHERDSVQTALRVSTLQNTLADAAIDARRGQFEPARKAASQFFTNLQAELDKGDSSVFNEAQRNSLRAVFANRDEVITLLARSDAAALDRLAAIYDRYRQAARPALQH